MFAERFVSRFLGIFFPLLAGSSLPVHFSPNVWVRLSVVVVLAQRIHLTMALMCIENKYEAFCGCVYKCARKTFRPHRRRLLKRFDTEAWYFDFMLVFDKLQKKYWESKVLIGLKQCTFISCIIFFIYHCEKIDLDSFDNIIVWTLNFIVIRSISDKGI